MEDVVLLSCGAFSPPTIMHFRLMEQCREYIESKLEVRVTSGFFSPVCDAYGKDGLVGINHRLGMLREACKSSEWLRVWEWEGMQSEWTPTAVVMRKLQEEYGMKVMLCAGSDILQSFSISNLWSSNDIAFICANGLLVSERGLVDCNRLILEHPVMFEHRWNIHIVPQPVPTAISSTSIRMLIKRGLSIRYLVDESVREYIESNGLYK